MQEQKYRIGPRVAETREPASDCDAEIADKYFTLFEQASDGVHTYDFQGNFLDVNMKLCQMLGYTRAELLRLNVRDLIPASDLKLAPLQLEELRAGETIISERQICMRLTTAF
jgi:PAS domain S-box-containing protein